MLSQQKKLCEIDLFCKTETTNSQTNEEIKTSFIFKQINTYQIAT